MAEFGAIHGAGCCVSPVHMYLQDTFLADEGIQQKISESMKKTEIKASNPVSVMYTGGNIRPIVDGQMSKVDAIGFHNGKVEALGSKDCVRAQMKNLGTEFTEIDLPAGNTLLPGLIEPHVHIVPTALMMAWNDFSPFVGQELRKFYCPKWLKEEIGRIKEELNEGHWILGQGLDPSLMPFLIPMPSGLTILQSFGPKELDEVEKVVPLFAMSASGHTAYVNTPAIKVIYYGLPEPIQDQYNTCDDYVDYVIKNGGLQESDVINALAVIPKLQLSGSVLNLNENLESLFTTATQRGVTLMYDAAMTSQFKCILKRYSLVGTKVRIGCAQICQSLNDAKCLKENNQPLIEFENVYQGSVKLVSDGSNQGLTGYQSKPYCCEPENNLGFFNFPPFSRPEKMTPDLEYVQIMETIIKKGWQLMIHSNGDKTTTLTLEAYKYALGGESGKTKRHRIEHASLLDKCTLQSMCDLGISPSFLIGHVGYWGFAFKNGILKERAEQLDLCKSAVSKGMRITLHSDYFVSPLGPLRLMEQAITRIMEEDPDGNVLNENEKLTPEQALKAVTYDAAWQCHADQWVGSLDVGKMADFVILKEDPITRKDPIGMRNIPVLETWVGGVRVQPLTKS